MREHFVSVLLWILAALFTLHTVSCSKGEYALRTVDQCYGKPIPVVCDPGHRVRVVSAHYRQTQQCSSGFHSNFCHQTETGNPACVGNRTCVFTTPWVYISAECGYSNNFLINFQCIPDTLLTDVCGLQREVSHSLSGYVVSPRYPEKYPTKTTCALGVVVPPGYKIRFYLLDLYLAYYNYNIAKQCIDRLWITDGVERSQYICSSEVRTAIFTSNSNRANVHFASDTKEFQNAKGFWLYYEAFSDVAATVTTTTSTTPRPTAAPPYTTTTIATKPTTFTTTTTTLAAATTRRHTSTTTTPTTTRATTTVRPTTRVLPTIAKLRSTTQQTFLISKTTNAPETKAPFSTKTSDIFKNKILEKTATPNGSLNRLTRKELTALLKIVKLKMDAKMLSKHMDRKDGGVTPWYMKWFTSKPTTKRGRTSTSTTQRYTLTPTVPNLSSVPQWANKYTISGTQTLSVKPTASALTSKHATKKTTPPKHTRVFTKAITIPIITPTTPEPTIATTKATGRVMEVVYGTTEKPWAERQTPSTPTTTRTTGSSNTMSKSTTIPSLSPSNTHPQTKYLIAGGGIITASSIIGEGRADSLTNVGGGKGEGKEGGGGGGFDWRNLLKTWEIGAIGGGAAGLVVITIIISLTIVFVRRKRLRTMYQKCRATANKPYGDVIMAYGSDDSLPSTGVHNMAFDAESPTTSTEDIQIDSPQHGRAAHVGGERGWGGGLGPIDERIEDLYTEVKQATGKILQQQATRGDNSQLVFARGRSKSMDDLHKAKGESKNGKARKKKKEMSTISMSVSLESLGSSQVDCDSTTKFDHIIDNDDDDEDDYEYEKAFYEHLGSFYSDIALAHARAMQAQAEQYDSAMHDRLDTYSLPITPLTGTPYNTPFIIRKDSASPRDPHSMLERDKDGDVVL